MKIFNTQQIRAWDAFTIEQEPVASEDLMERAGIAVTDRLAKKYASRHCPLVIFAGTGNNGGDGMVIAFHAAALFPFVTVYIAAYNAHRSRDFSLHYGRLQAQNRVNIRVLEPGAPWPAVPGDAVVVDALLGSGISRPMEGDWAALIHFLNALPNVRISVDVPSGMLCDGHTPWSCVAATATLTFEQPKYAFFFPENASKTGEWEVLPIGLHPEYARREPSSSYYLTAAAAQALVRVRSKFSHKGHFGHALLWAGGYGKVGAAILAARACLRAGVGLLTVHSPRCAMIPLQTAVPEAMYEADGHETTATTPPGHPEMYQCIGAGCGTGTEAATANALEALLRQAGRPVVLDADALNLLARHPHWWALLPEGTILTPHPKEFERLFGKTANDFERNALQRAKAQEHRVILLLKGAHTAIALPNGNCWFNSTGNPGMATAGSGDVLTGILTALLAQGYAPKQAALLGTWLHGAAGDHAAQEWGEESLTAGNIVEKLPDAWKSLKNWPAGGRT